MVKYCSGITGNDCNVPSTCTKILQTNINNYLKLIVSAVTSCSRDYSFAYVKAFRKEFKINERTSFFKGTLIESSNIFVSGAKCGSLTSPLN